MNLPADTFPFLTELKANNNREWFNDQKPRFKVLHDELLDFIDALIGQMMPYDPLLAGVRAQDCLFRLHKDARFSKGQAPYKTHFGIHIVNSGKRSDFNRAGFYLGIESQGCVLAGGAHAPSAPWLLAIRQKIAVHGGELMAILADENLLKFYGQLRGDSLKRIPRGFAADEPFTDLLKRKAFWLQHELADEVILGADFMAYYERAFVAYRPLQVFLNN